MTEIAIPYVARCDLRSFQRSRDQETYFVVADKVRNQHTELSEVEFFIFDFIKGETKTFGQLTNALIDAFGASYSDEQVFIFLERLFSLNLVSKPGFEAGKLLYEQKRNHDRANWKRFVFGWLSIKIPGFYPGPLLRMLEPVGSIVFSRLTLLSFAVVLLATILYAILNYPTVFAKIPDQALLLSVDHLFLVVCAYILVKVVHELGHGLACQRIGHECTEMGLIFLVFMPCLYCDVSDVWTQENKWKRIFVSAAGVLVEIAVAITCFWAWMLVDDGKLAALLFSVMLITSLNTLFINGNPLMRFDGYYVLSDLLDIPNLAARASAVLRSYLTGFFVIQNDEEDDKSGVQLTYAIAAVCYRCFILISIGFAIWYFFDSYDLSTIGNLAILFLAVTILVPIIGSLNQMRRTAYGKINFAGLTFVSLLIAGMILVFLIPFSYRVFGQAEFRLAQGQQVFATDNGFFERQVSDGDEVAVDSVIGKIIVPDNATKKAALQGELEEIQSLLKASELYEQTPKTAAEREFLGERHESLQAEVAEFAQQELNLVIRSSQAGRFIAARHPDLEIAELRNNALNVFQPANERAFVKRGSLLGYIGSGDELEGTFEVSENEIDKIQAGDVVKVYDNVFAWTGKVSKIALENSPASANDQATGDQKQENVYLVTFQLEAASTLKELPIASQRKIVVYGSRTNLLKSLLKKMNVNVW